MESHSASFQVWSGLLTDSQACGKAVDFLNTININLVIKIEYNYNIHGPECRMYTIIIIMH